MKVNMDCDCDDKDTEILRLRAQVVDTEFMLAMLIRAYDTETALEACVAVARGLDGSWVDQALRMGNTVPVRPLGS